jgi:site-specific recombinase XerD
VSSLNISEHHPLYRLAESGSRVWKSRLALFCEWQARAQQPWYQPDLPGWRDHLLHGEAKAPQTVTSYLSSVRSAYRQLLRSNDFRDRLYAALPTEMPQERKFAYITEVLTRLKNDIDPENAPISIATIQDQPDSDHLWLTPDQVAHLVSSPGVDTLKRLRDTALIALLLCTGIRAAELVALDVSDLRTTLGGELALRVRAGKGIKQRLIPYGAQDWGVTLTEAWLKQAGISQGPAFVALRKGSHFYDDAWKNPKRLAVNAVGTILLAYPISIAGYLTCVKPHDLRRTYARQLYLIGTDLVAIQQNLGHDSQKVTLSYVGTLDASERAPADAYGHSWLRPLWDALALNS